MPAASSCLEYSEDPAPSWNLSSILVSFPRIISDLGFVNPLINVAYVTKLVPKVKNSLNFGGLQVL